MMRDNLQIGLFKARVLLTKVVILVLGIPMGTAMLLAAIPRRHATWEELFGLYSIHEWRRVWGTSVEAIVGCRWFIVGAECPDSLPRYSYWDVEDQLICCLFLEDAVMLNMKVGGILTQTPKKTIKNNVMSGDDL